MQLATIVLLSTINLAKSFLTVSISGVTKSNRSKLIEATIDVLESCYIDRFVTVGLAGRTAGNIIRIMSSRGAVIPVTLIDETAMTASPVNRQRESQYKLQVFVVMITDPSSLEKTIKPVKNSKWWNHKASFLFIHRSSMETGCSNAQKILFEAWKMNLLNAKFLCLHRTRGKLIYTFNPYISKAPAPWQQVDTYSGINGHVWTLFGREYRDNESLCDLLDFDKTSDLGGYGIRASVLGMENWWYADPEKKPNIFNRVKNITAQILVSSLNATWNFSVTPENDLPPRDKKGNPSGVAADVINGRSDICFNFYSAHMWVEYATTYPHYHSSLAVITQYAGYKSQLDKIISVLDRSSRYGVSVVLLVTILFFKCWLGKPIIPAMLNIVLLMCNAALRQLPNNLASRIYLGSLFMFVLTIQGIYQSQLASLLTSQVRLPNIESMEDLARSDHTIFGSKSYQVFFNQPAFEGRYVALDTISCTDHVLRDAKAACAHERLRLTGEAAKFNVHLTREPLISVNYLYLIRPDWPLEDRVNLIYERAAASGVIKYMYTRQLNNVINCLESRENKNQDQTLKVLTLKDLKFAFVIVGVGLGLATISFLIEVAIFSTPIAKFKMYVRR